MTGDEFARLANNFYIEKGLESHIERIQLDADLQNYIINHQKDLETTKKVAFVFICLNPLYWEFVGEMVQGARKFFLPGHKTDFYFWTDIPEDPKPRILEAWKALPEKNINTESPEVITRAEQITNTISELRKDPTIHLIPTEPIEWPYPTLMRYSLFLQEEHKLKDYDYIFYCDVDMKFNAIVGDEILGNGITAALHPMYALRKEYWPPYEPNEQSASYIKRPGKVVNDNGQPRFMPMYFAGGFQGGTAKEFIQAMKDTRELIDKDLNHGYIPIWNDETAWNKYLSENPPDVVLTPAYVYPDSLINEYYVPLWGRNYQPKLITITKWFSTSKAGGQAVSKMLNK